MWPRDYRDMVGGGLLVLLGIFTLIYSLTELRLGTVSRMGPGFFPAILGVLLSGLGLGIMIPALFRSGAAVRVDIRTLLVICAAVIAFALMVRPFGLIPATVVLILVGSRADSAMTLVRAGIFAVCLSLAATLVFQVGLGLQLSPINWPW